MSDAVGDGLLEIERELLELARRLGPRETASENPPTSRNLPDSPMAGDLGRLLVDTVAEGVRSFAARLRTPLISRFTSRSAPVAPREVPRAASSPPVAPPAAVASNVSRVDVVAPAF